MEIQTVRGVDLHFDNSGDGPPMVWGHGLMSCRVDEDELGILDWKQIREQCRVLRYDARGHGASESDSDITGYSWCELALDQLALADELGIGHYVGGGASMGCATALYAALMQPDRITALVLAMPPTAWATRPAQSRIYNLTADLVEIGEYEVIAAGFESRPTPDPFIDVPSWRVGVENKLRTIDPIRLASLFRGAALSDLPDEDAIATIGVPTLILAWTGDASHPMSTATRLAELMPRADLVVASTFEQITAWTPTTIDFLSSL